MNMRRVLSLTAVLCGLVWLLAAGVSVGRVWYIQTVDSHDSVGSDLSMALDANACPRISYRDGTNYDLKYAAWNGTGWDIQVVHPGTCASHATHTSLVLDSRGYPHICYRHG